MSFNGKTFNQLDPAEKAEVRRKYYLKRKELLNIKDKPGPLPLTPEQKKLNLIMREIGKLSKMGDIHISFECDYKDPPQRPNIYNTVGGYKVNY